jgi:hypothetical protein
MVAKKTLTIEEQLEATIIAAIKKRMPDIIQKFFDCMAEEGTNIEKGLDYFGDYLYDDGFADISNDINNWAIKNLAIKTTVVLKTQIEK